MFSFVNLVCFLMKDHYPNDLQYTVVLYLASNNVTPTRMKRHELSDHSTCILIISNVKLNIKIKANNGIVKP